jgi:hypothetical protein
VRGSGNGEAIPFNPNFNLISKRLCGRLTIKVPDEKKVALYPNISTLKNIPKDFPGDSIGDL